MPPTVFRCCLALMLLLCSTLALAAEAPAIPEGKIADLEKRTAAAASTSANEYAKDLLESAKGSIGNAKVNFAAGKHNLASRQLELAESQLASAVAKAAEKELQEKVAVRRAELKKMEAKLERFRQGEEN